VLNAVALAFLLLVAFIAWIYSMFILIFISESFGIVLLFVGLCTLNAKMLQTRRNKVLHCCGTPSVLLWQCAPPGPGMLHQTMDVVVAHRLSCCEKQYTLKMDAAR